jgi:shikimate kinase
MKPEREAGYNASMRESRNIYLVGLMGAGKTTIGKALARLLRRPFIDCDHEIELRTGVKVSVIFEIEGEQGFRLRESQTLADLVLKQDVVLATGGGAVLDPDNRTRLAAHGFVVYLRAAPHDLWLRTRHDRGRPLLQTADPVARLQELHRLRDPLYAEVADLVVDSGRQRAGMLVTRILHLLPEQCKASA